MNAETLAAMGIDPAGPATISFIRQGKVSCMRLADPMIFQTKAAPVLTAGGTTPVRTTTTKGHDDRERPPQLRRPGRLRLQGPGDVLLRHPL